MSRTGFLLTPQTPISTLRRLRSNSRRSRYCCWRATVSCVWTTTFGGMCRRCPTSVTPLTIRMLLNHTSGLRELANLFYFSGWRNSDEQYKSDVLAMIRRQRALNHVPGAEFSYNSSGYTFLAFVVERVSGVSFRRFIIDRIFTPLGMAHSDVQEDVDQVIPHRATGLLGSRSRETTHRAAVLLVRRPRRRRHLRRGSRTMGREFLRAPSRHSGAC